MAGNPTTNRRSYILGYLKENELADVTALSGELGVSEMTIRRDFAKLEEEKLLLRVHGGAVRLPSATDELSLTNRLSVCPDEKLAIGRYAASLIEEGDVIALDASSTALMVADHLQVAATVVTSNLEAVIRLLKNPLADIVLLGGHVRKTSASTVGFEMTRMMRDYRVDKVFLSSKAADLTHGLSDATVEEGEGKKAMIAAGRKAYLLLDHTKLGTTAFYKVCDIDKRFEIITDRSDTYTEEQQAFVDHCREGGIPVHFA